MDKENELKRSKKYLKMYRKMMNKLEKEIIPNLTFESPIKNIEADEIIIDEVILRYNNMKKGIKRLMNTIVILYIIIIILLIIIFCIV